MAKTEDNSNKLYGTGIGENNVTPETSGLTNIGSKITTLNPGDKYKMIDAFNIDWESGEYTYSNTNNGEIIHSTGHFVEIVKQKASTSELNSLRETVDSLSNRSADYFEQRWGVFDKNVTPSDPNNDTTIELNVEHATWKLTPVYENNKYTWMIARKVIYNNNNTATYSGDWSTPIRISGSDGTSYPIQPVIKYQWTASNTNAPQLDQDENGNAGNAWKESPGNPTSTNIYLWMIQGQRQNGAMITWDANSDGTVGTNEYWSAPVCLSGPDGQPGKDGDDLEFIYHIYDTVQVFENNNNNPNHWEVSSQDNYLGPDGYKWNDNPTGVTITNKYEYCSYRRKTGNPKAWTKFSTPFPWSIYGENGIDGDGVEYIYAVTSTDEAPTQPIITSTNYAASQQSEWGVDNSLWFDDPQEVNNANQKYQWVSTRKYRYPKSNETTLGGQALNKNKKYWFDYSTPQLWNWYVNEGTNADRIVMLYKRTNSSIIVPAKPSKHYGSGTIGTYVNAGVNEGWVESPGNNTDLIGDEYLWMSSNYYSEKWTSGHQSGGVGPASENYPIYKITDEWSTPVCLTGEPGHEGEDGSDIEFIYYRTADDNVVPTLPVKDDNFQNNDWPFIGTKNTDYYEIDGIKYYGTNSVSSPDELHNVWTDNPLGVTPTYDYEYAAVRRKPAGSNSQWGDFSPVFLWSKYGENGVDGDGVEYIYYLSGSNQPITFSDSDSTNNPKKWSITSTEEGKYGKKFQDNEYVGPVGSEWTDDPTGVSPGHNYEYVSVRRKKLKTGSTTEKEWGSFSEPTLWSHYGDDTVVNMITVDSDNDMMGVAIDDNGVVKQTTTSEATMSMWYQNIEIYEYTTTLISSNYNGEWTTTQTSGNTVYTSSDGKIVLTITPAKNSTPKSGAKIAITINENTSLPTGNQLHITLQLVETSSTIEGENKKMFTFNVIGLQVPQIYQLRMDKKVIRRDVNNNYADANSNNVVTLYPSVVTSDGTLITDKSNLASQDLYVFYQIEYMGNIQQESAESTQYGVEVANNASSNMYFNVQDQIITILNTTSTSYVKKVTVYLIYGDKPSNKTSQVEIGGGDDNNQENNIVMDRETIYVVSDGHNGQAGADSKSQEYIYFLCDEPEKTFADNENPVLWSTNQNYQADDYPFTGENGANVLENGWTDHPQGIDETHRYEYISTRTYDTSTKKWGAFSEPVIWANWGHMGEDGDGVEYIYYLCDEENKQFDETNDPQYWTNDTGFQASEYLRPGTSWTDNPSGVGPNNKYEYVSVRKYNNSSISSNDSFKFVESYNTEITENNSIRIFNWTSEGTTNNYWNYTTNDDLQTRLHYDIKGNINASNLLYVLLKNLLNKYLNDMDGIPNGISEPIISEDKYIYIGVDDPDNPNNNINKKTTDIYALSILFARSNGDAPGHHSFDIYNYKDNGQTKIKDKIDELNDIVKSYGFIIKYQCKGTTHIYCENINTEVNTQKQWQPYSEPTLWAKYGENGGSGLTIDFDNPSMQIAVNSNGFIKDNQSVITYLNVYDGSTLIDPQYIRLSLNYPTNNDYEQTIFETAYETRIIGVSKKTPFGCTIYDKTMATGDLHAQCTYYTWKFGDIDNGSNDTTENDGIISAGENPWGYDNNFFKLNENCKLQFRISYNGINYYKNVTFVPIQYGKDGEDAETFELNCSSSVIRKTLNSYDPSIVQYKIKHKKGNSTPDFITVDENGQGNGDYSNFKIYYKGVTETQNSQLVTEPQTHFYGNVNGDSTDNESGMYSATGASIGTTGSSTSNLYSDPENENLTGDDVVVVTVREVTLVDDNNETLPNAQEEILNALDDSYGWTNIMNTASTDSEYTMPEYDSNNIQSVIYTLTDYGTYLANKGKGYATEATEVTNVVNAISDVTSTIGTTDTETGTYTINEGYETICVAVRDENTGTVQKEIMTKADAITIKEQDISNKETSSASSSEGGQMSGGTRLQSRGGGTPMYAPSISDNTLSNYTEASNGTINVSNLTGNLTAIEVILVYNDNELWDTDILEIVYDGVDGAAGAFKSTVFKRNKTEPSKPENGADYSTGLPLTPNGWSDSIPNATGTTILPIWASSATITPSNASSVVWSNPRLMADTELYDVEFAFEQAYDATPAEPTTENRHKYNSPYEGQIWFDPTLDKNSLPSDKTWSDMVWRAEREKTPGTTTWSDWVITRIKGEKGNPGNNGNDAYIIDWANDQINLAVDGDGHIIGGENGQLKETSISIESLNGVFGSSPTISMEWYVYSSGSTLHDESPCKKFAKDGTSVGTVRGVNDSQTGTINFFHGNNTNGLRIGVPANFTSNNAYIPENGIEIKVKVSISGNGKSISNVDKILRVCGQHNGENAVTLELNPSNNAIYKDNTTFSPSSISVQLTKYNGAVPEVLSYNAFSSNYLVSYLIEGYSTTRYYTGDAIDCSTARSGSSIDGNIILRLHKTTATNSSIIDRETIPLINRGEAGSQGFTGPVVRYCGEWKSSNNGGPSKYYNGLVQANVTSVPNVYYKDIVYRNEHYYTPASSSTFDTTGEFINIGYISNGTSWNSNNWVEATQFDFVATKLLYADQALINQISSHDFIATTEDGTPVAGITTGRIDDSGNPNTINSFVSNNGNDFSNPVRIFAGTTSTTQSLTTAPFTVRQDGTVNMSKSNVVGDVNIGGTVTIGGDVTISGDYVSISGDISADTLTLTGNKSFYYNEQVDLPWFDTNQHKVIYVMYYNYNNRIITPDNESYLWMVRENNGDFYMSNNPGEGIEVPDKCLYTLYSGYGNKPNTNTPQKFWIITKTNLYPIPESNTPATASYSIPSNKVSISEASLITINNELYPRLFIRLNVTDTTAQYTSNNVTYNQFVRLDVSLSFNSNYKYIICPEDILSNIPTYNNWTSEFERSELCSCITPKQLNNKTVFNDGTSGSTIALPSNNSTGVGTEYQLYFMLSQGSLQTLRNEYGSEAGYDINWYLSSNDQWSKVISINKSNISVSASKVFTRNN